MHSTSTSIPRLPSSLRLLDGLIDRLGHILDVARIQAGHTDASILRQIDMPLLPHDQGLLLRQAREAEHADLIRDMLPAAFLSVQLLQLASQGFPHVDDPSSHGPQVGLPFREEDAVVEHQARDTGAVRGRVADLAALQDGQLRGDP